MYNKISFLNNNLISNININLSFLIFAYKRKAKDDLLTNLYTVKAYKQNKKISQDLIR
jgi:type IV secretory pathway TrbL component